jgi:hypothetical protein
MPYIFEEHRNRTYEPTDISEHQTAFATALRIPFITTTHPRWRYTTAIIVRPDEKYGPAGQIPAEAEVRKVAALDAYHRRYLTDAWVNAMAEFAPYDLDTGNPGRYLLKYADGRWGYRIGTWTYGYPIVPPMFGKDAETLTLDQVLDRMHYDAEPWHEWKAEHPEVFA